LEIPETDTLRLTEAFRRENSSMGLRVVGNLVGIILLLFGGAGLWVFAQDPSAFDAPEAFWISLPLFIVGIIVLYLTRSRTTSPREPSP
ncbi:MAG: hypothetical protein ACE5KH_06130, partial [Candidatus Geothermarchaeales archaeon]